MMVTLAVAIVISVLSTSRGSIMRIWNVSSPSHATSMLITTVMHVSDEGGPGLKEMLPLNET